MQTFLPYADFEQSAKCLDGARLWKQCVEAKQLLMGQSANHPASKMWRGYETGLALYGLVMCTESLSRGIDAGEVKQYFADYLDGKEVVLPPWLGHAHFHATHRSNLLRKDLEYYFKFGWDEHPSIPYYWPV